MVSCQCADVSTRLALSSDGAFKYARDQVNSMYGSAIIEEDDEKLAEEIKHFRHKLHEILEGTTAQVALLMMAIIEMLVLQLEFLVGVRGMGEMGADKKRGPIIKLDNEDQVENLLHIGHTVSMVIVIIFLVEALLSIYCLRCKYFAQPMLCFDLISVLVTLILNSHLNTDAFAILMLLRVWRLIRVLEGCQESEAKEAHIAAFVNVAENVRSPLLQQIESLRMALGMDLWDPDSGQGRDPWAPTGFSVEGWKLPVAFCAAPFGNQEAKLEDAVTVAASPATANSALVNASEVNGKVALVWNDDCDHATKARNCWQAGAIGVVIINQTPMASPPQLEYDKGNQQIEIPVVSIARLPGLQLWSEPGRRVTISFEQANPAPGRISDVKRTYYGP